MSTKPLILYFGLFILLFFSSCEKCEQEEPLIKLTFINYDSGDVYNPSFDKITSEGLRKSLPQTDTSISIPLDLSKNLTTYYFSKNDTTDTLSISYNTSLSKESVGICLLITEAEIAQSSFDIKCSRFESGFTYYSCAEYYEIKIYY